MSKQVPITSYFGKRKRIGTDDVRANAKKLLLEAPQKVGLEPSQKIIDFPAAKEKDVGCSAKEKDVGCSTKEDEVVSAPRDIEKTPVKKTANVQSIKLSELEKKKKENLIPRLTKFDSLEIEVPKSPHKSKLYSPIKRDLSPVKPAYQRYAGLVETTTPLPLPFGFQKLLELFRAVDTVCSMMVNRSETITFKKLKPAVQEMTRKNFTLRHLGQMAAVLPQAFTFHQEKLRNYGSTSKADRYELVIRPVIPQNEQQGRKSPLNEDDIIRNADRMTMTPKILKSRREAFHKALFERTIDCHEEFLKTLEPPLEIPRSDLKRWHPNFMVDHVPDVVPQELPQPPYSERPSTAKDVLDRAREFLSSNARLQKALEAASQSADTPKEAPPPVASKEVKEKVDAKINDLKNPLKGISKSLLEKIRAKQAAKALDTMTMTPEQEKETLMYVRLPVMARIVRTLFVNEQKGVISWDTLLEKVQFSYDRNLSKGEIEAHVKLLLGTSPEWLSKVHIRNTDYLKMNRKAELSAVMEKLEKIVAEKKKKLSN